MVLHIANNSFNSECRVRSSEDYSKLRRIGKRYHTRNFVVYISCNSFDFSRLGLTVSRKVGNAVVRNRLKRWLRECFRTQLKFIFSSHDFSIVAKPGAAYLTHVQVIEELFDFYSRWKLGK